MKRLCCLFLACAASFAADPRLLRLLPPDAAFVAGIDLADARESSLGNLILHKTATDPKLTTFFQTLGIVPERDFREILIAPNSNGSSLVVVAGAFDYALIQTIASSLPDGVESVHGMPVFKNPQKHEAVAFTSSGEAVIGPEQEVLDALERLKNGAQAPADLLDSVRKASAGHDLWVISAGAANLIPMGSPGARPNPLAKIRRIRGGAKSGEPSQVSFECETESTADAANVADALRAITGMIAMDPKSPLSGMKIDTAGAIVRIDFGLAKSAVLDLLKLKQPNPAAK